MKITNSNCFLILTKKIVKSNLSRNIQNGYIKLLLLLSLILHSYSSLFNYKALPSSLIHNLKLILQKATNLDQLLKKYYLCPFI